MRSSRCGFGRHGRGVSRPRFATGARCGDQGLAVFLSADSDRLRRFEQEARAAAALNHPNILAVHQMGTYEGAPYLVSELLEGETLREQIQAGPSVSAQGD
jgi:serine/threonine protein kinase